MAAPTSRISYVAAAKATLDGARARRDRLPVTECPYQPNGTAAQRFLARYWIKGWNRAYR